MTTADTAFGIESAQRGEGRRRPRTPSLEVGKRVDRLPPHSLEAEMSLLGSLILDPRMTADVLGMTPSGDVFYAEHHAAIFDAILRLYDSRQSGDLTQLIDALRDKSILDDIGGPDYLLRLAESVPSAVNAPHYARIVSEKARLRRLIDAAGRILYDAYHAGELGEEGAREVLDQAERLIFDVAEEAQSSSTERLEALLQQALDMLEANEGRRITGLATGFHQLDDVTSGLQPGELIIVAARPSMGKTALALNLAEQIAMHGAPGGGAAPTAIFSLEMSRQAVAQRLMCACSGVDSHLLRTNRLSEKHYQQLIRACGELGEAPIFVDDTPGMTVMQLRARARRLAAQHGIRCIIIDYLQLMTAPGSARESRQVEVSAISRGVKALARELNVPVVCLAQLNRGAEQREGHRPRMSDLRESGSIEQDADVIMLLHREDYYHQGDPSWADENPDKVGVSEIIVAKQRNGPTGVVSLMWNPETTRFTNPRWAYDGHAPAHGAADDTAPSRQPATFAPGPKSGPISGHRDGGGPDRDWDDTDDDLPI